MQTYYKNKRILITGGCGFLGSNLAHKLIDLGANVTLIDNLDPLYGGNLYNICEIKEKVNFIKADIRDDAILIPLIKEVNIIFHFAAQVSYIDSLSMPFEDYELNAGTTLKILELCRKFNPKVKIVFSSSRMVLGKVDGEKITESSPTNPLSLYGIHKLTSEKYLLMYYKDFQIPVVIMRITNPYGPRQQVKHNKYSLVGWFIRQAMENKTIKIFGEGLQLRDYVFSEDIAEAFLKCGCTEKAIGEIINIGSGISSRFFEMVEEIIRVVKKGKIEYIPWPNEYERIETGDIKTDISKLQKLTLWEPRHSLSEGIKKTFEYYQRNINNYV